jgi:hypothetical protein
LKFNTLGDAVYHDKQIFPFDAISHGTITSKETLKHDYDVQLQNKDYKRFIEKIPIIGVCY